MSKPNGSAPRPGSRAAAPAPKPKPFDEKAQLAMVRALRGKKPKAMPNEATESAGDEASESEG